MLRTSARSLAFRVSALAAGVAVLVAGVPLAAEAATYPSDSTAPNLVNLLSGFTALWQSDGKTDLHGTVEDAATLAHNDELAVWVNNHASSAQQFIALQDAVDSPSQLVQDAFGSQLGPIYLQGIKSGALPLTNALLSAMGSYVSTTDAKSTYNFPRPYLRSDVTTADSACNVTSYNGSSLASNRVGKSYADAKGNLNIVRLPDQTDTSGKYGQTTVSATYGSYCSSASFPSGHTTSAYLDDLTLATLLPQLAPQILARASEAGNDRIVLGVHYPLDVIGGRMDGEAAVASRWADASYRSQVLIPAQQELVNYLQAQCGDTLAHCIAGQTAYANDPYNGAAIPGGTAQTVTDTASAVTAYHERLTYGFAQSGDTTAAPAVPSAASHLLDTTFPTLTDAQRTSVLAQTEIASGYPLDETSTGNGSYQRLDLAAAMTATVRLASDGSVSVTSTGGAPHVVSDAATLTAPDGTSVAAGSAITLVGAGFTAGTSYRLVWADDHDTTIGTLTPAGDGSVSTSVTVPADTASGARQLDVLDASGASVLAAPLGITVTASTDTQSVTTKSPDGKTSATVFVDQSGALGYTVVQNGETVVQRSSLGLVVGGTDYGTGVTLGNATRSSENSTYPLLGTHSTATDDYRGATIPVVKGGTSSLGVEVRVFDTGVALRYDLAAGLAGQTVSTEKTTFAFAPSSSIAYQPVSASTVDDLQGDTTMGTLSALGTKQIVVLPTIQTPNGHEYANITEAAVRDWPAIALTTSTSGSISTYYWATDNGKGTFAVSANTLHSPFRVITVASNLTDLLNSDIITSVNDPIDTSVFPNGDTSWIQTGTSAWASLDQSVGQNQSVTVISKLIDGASAAHMPDVLIEGQLADSSWGTTTAQRFAHVKDLVQQGLAEPNPVHIWLWTNYDNGAGSDSTFTSTVDYTKSNSTYAKNSLQNPDFRDAYLDLVKSTGVVGVKVDHIGNETETKVNLYGDVDKAAAQRQLMIEFHNPLEPTGINRTYPNEVGREAIRGAEINYAADQDTVIPFTRYVDGTADYTPLLFSNSSKLNNATWAHEVASTVVYTNPYLQLSEKPANVADGGIYHALLGDLVKNLPTTWKSSWVLPQSSLGGRIAGVVRETEDGEYWVALMATPGSAQTLSIPLSFLPAGTTYNADVYADRQSPSSLSRTTAAVTSTDTLRPTLNSGGGYLVRITTKAIDNPSSGSGGNPEIYTIASEADLGLIAQHPDATFNLTADIQMTSAWTPVVSFTGTLNGNGHTIKGLNVTGGESKAFIIDNQGTIRQLGFADPLSIVNGDYVQSTRVAVVAVTNDGTIDQVYTKNADVEGGWRTAPIAAENNGSITDSYSVDSRVIANWEAGGLVAFNSATGLIGDSYVAGANVTSVVSNGGILTGYGYTGTQITGDVVYSGSVVVPTSGNFGRLLGRENGTPTYTNDLSLNTATVNGAVVTGGTTSNKSGADTTAAQLQTQSTYEGIGWDFDTVWKWDATLKRPVLLTVGEASDTDTDGNYTVSTEAGLRLIGLHPDATFTLAADITMTQPWTPVSVFTGTLNGNGHTISNLTVSGSASKAFVLDNKGTIRKLGFNAPTSIVTGAYVQTTRVAVVAVTNDGTIDQVYTRGADVEGGWRTAPIAAENNATISNSYTAATTVVSNWESGALVGWNSATGVVKNDYVQAASVKTVVNNGGIFSGYGFAGTKFTSNVVISGALVNPGTKIGRIDGQENGTPTYTNNLALNTATINGAVVTGGTATNKNGKDTTAALLATQSTYTGIGWDFTTIWKWDTILQRPTLASVREVQVAPKVTVPTPSLAYQVGSTRTPAQLLTASGATTDKGTIAIDASTVDFTTVGTYTATVTADYDGTPSAPAPVTVHVVPIVAIQVQHDSLLYATGTAITSALVKTDAGATLNTSGTVTADLGSLDASTPGAYDVALTATDDYGFTAQPVTVHVTVADAPVITLDHDTTAVQVGATPIPTQADIIVALGAHTTSGTLTVDLGGVDFATAGSYAVSLTGTGTDGVAAVPVAATVRVVPVIGIQVLHDTLVYATGTAIDEAKLKADAGAALSTDGTLTVDFGSFDASTPGTYAVTLRATDGYGFTAQPVVVHVTVADAPVISLDSQVVTLQVGPPATASGIIQALGARTSSGTLSIDLGDVDFAHEGEYTVSLSGTSTAGIDALPVTATVKVVTVTAIETQRTALSYPASSTTPITAAQLIADLGAGADNGAGVTVDASGLNADLPGDYTVTLQATDRYGFSAAAVHATVTITAASTATTLASSSAAQTFGGAPVTLTATVTGGDGSLLGSVVFSDGATTLATVEAGSGVAQYTLPRDLAVGAHGITARFASGESASGDSTSASVAVTVNAAPTKTVLSTSKKTQVYGGSPAVVTATVTGGDGSPSGTVTFSEGTKRLASVALKSGSARYTLSRTLAVGKHTITARFVSSEATGLGSASGSVAITATKAASKTTLTVADRTLRGAQRPRVTVTVKAPGVSSISGSVRVYDGTRLLKTAKIGKGKVTVTLAKLSHGSHRLHASFAATSTVAASTSATVRVSSAR